MKTNRRTLLCVVATSALALASAAHAQDTPGVDAKSITLGQMNSTTGPLAAYGIPLRSGAEAFVKSVNAKGGINGRQINLIAEDNAFSTPQSLAITRKMVSNDHIFALINSNGNVQVAATIPYVLEQSNTPIFGSYGGIVEWFTPPRKGLFGLQVLYEDMARVLGRWVAKDGMKNVVVVHIEGATFAKAAKATEPAYKAAAAAGAIDFMPVKLPTSDYAPIALQIIQKKPDALIVMQTEGEFLALAKELANQGAKIPVYAWAPVVTQQAIERGGANVEGVKAVSWTPSPLSDKPAIKEYREALAKYVPSEKPDFISLFAYAQTKVLTQAFAQAKEPLTRDSFYNALYAMKSYDSGILPPVTFSPERHLGVTALIPMEIRKGAWVEKGSPIDSSNPAW